MRKLTQNDFIIRSKKVYGDIYGYDKVNYVNNHTKVKIYCKKCKKYFYQIPNSHLSGHGCNTCGINNTKTTQRDFIIRSKKVHGNKYEYDKVNYVNVLTKVKIYCKKCKKYFNQRPNDHLYGQGCNTCGINNRKTTQNDFIINSKKVHGDIYGYDKVNYINAYTKVTIYCKKCKRYFNQRPNDHLYGQGCNTCGINNRKTTQKDFIIKSKKVHGDIYGYDKVNYVNSYTNVKIYCKKCKRYFYQTPNNHLRGKGCKTCGINNKKTTQKDFIIKSKKVHGDIYEYDKVNYVKNQTKVKIYCKKCKKYFYQRPNDHLQGQGCPFCVHLITKPELAFLKYCKVPNKPSNRQVKIKRYKVDGFIKSKKQIFEFLGSIHHGDSRIYKRTDIHPIFKKTYGELYDHTIKRFNHLIELKGREYIIRYVWGRDWALYQKGLISKPAIKTFRFGQKRI